MPSDSELLTSYARERNQAAFAALVRGHVDLVYSAALRRVGGDPHAAAEVTQEVFLALARHAERLACHPVLDAWLHASTRNAAANVRRREQRRVRQKQRVQTMQEIAAEQNDAIEWAAVRGVLDEALDELSELDRQLIILRFFQGQSYPAIGDVVGLREEAARMRVGRALDKLRERLARRGIASTAAVLGGALTTHAVVAAPAGVVTAVSATVATAALAAPAFGFVSLMSISKVTVSVITVAFVVSAGVIYRWQSDKPAVRVAASVPEVVAPNRAAALTEAERRAAQLASLVADDQAKRGPAPSPATMEAEEKIAALRDVLARLPEQGIPELKLATNADWHVAVDRPLETPDDYRQALAKLRSLAEGRFGKLAQPALRAYLQANGQQFPAAALQLQPFVGEQVERAMLERYRIAPASEIPNMRVGGDWIITQNGLIDSEYDQHLVIGPNGFGTYSSLHSAAMRDSGVIMPVVRAYRAANGARHADVSQLLPYATTPEQRATIEKLIRKQTEGR